jgi:hypothetical protein
MPAVLTTRAEQGSCPTLPRMQELDSDSTTLQAGGDLVRWAAAESAALLHTLGDRWRHVQGVAEKATWVSQAFDGEDRPHLLAAALLHDVGYAPALRVTGLHQLDGALYLRSRGRERLANLVAHHSEARFELELRGWGTELARYPREFSPVAAALVYCDLTTGPQGTPTCFDDRVAEVLQRYGDDSLVAEALRRSRPFLAEAVEATQELLRRHGVLSP